MKSIPIMLAAVFLLAASGWAKFAVDNVNMQNLRLAVYTYDTEEKEEGITPQEAAETSKEGNKSTANIAAQKAAKNIIQMMRKKAPKKSGAFGLENLRLDTGFSYTEFNDSSIDAQADVEDFNLTLSGDINEKLSFTLGYNYNRLDTDKGIDIVIESEGLNGSILYRINDHYGVGAFASYNWVDIENINGNSFAWSTGAFFATSHDIEEMFTLSTVTSLYHIDYDSDQDHFASFLVDISKQWNDWLNTFVYGSYTASLRNSSNSTSDNSYFNFGVGFDVYATDQLTLSFTYDTTESIHNYNDQTFMFNVGYSF